MILQIRLFIVSLFTVFLFLPVQTGAAIRAAATCSYSDVLSVLNAASAGDTVAIPSGNCTWSNTLNITKSLTLQGAGSTSTVITSSLGANTPLINITLSSNVPFRLTGIGFSLGANDNGRRALQVNGNRTNSFALTQLRIDNCAVTGGGRYTVILDGWIEGLIDHCTFTNASAAIFHRGDDNHAWTRVFNAGGAQAGTANAMFIEDNTFILTNAAASIQDAQIYVQEGAVVVSRYNTFDSTAFTSVGFMTLILNDHGNQDYITSCPLGTKFRGQPLMEFYNNVAHVYKTDELIGIRGNSSIIHDNTFTYVTGSPTAIQLREEEVWQSAFFSPLRTQWPAQDQVHNTFIWNNTLNGNPITSVFIPTAGEQNFIQQDRDYFMHEPHATGGKSTFTGTRAGGSTTSPTTGDCGSMTFSSSGPNAYYPYTPYTYPHPLTTGTGEANVPSPPTSLRIR